MPTCVPGLQIFNMLNSRKIKHEFNIFAGLWRSRAFLYIFTIIVGLQIVIMLTPVGKFFSVTKQSGMEWLFAIVVGSGSLLVSIATKGVVRSCVCGGWWPPRLELAKGGTPGGYSEMEMTSDIHSSPSSSQPPRLPFAKAYRSVPNSDIDREQSSHEQHPDLEKALSSGHHDNPASCYVTDCDLKHSSLSL